MPTHVVIGRRLKALVVKFRDDKKQAARDASRAIQVARDAQYMADLAERNRCVLAEKNRCVPPGGLASGGALERLGFGRCTGFGGRYTGRFSGGPCSVVLDYSLVPSDDVLILLSDDVLVPSDDVLVLLYDVLADNVLVLMSDDARVYTGGKMCWY